MTTGARQKPDLILVPVWAYTSREKKGEGKSASEDSNRYGVVEGIKNYDTIRIFDSKLNMDNTALGELINHLRFQQLQLEKRGQIVRGMLFGLKGFYLLSLLGNELFGRIYGEWTDKGCGDFIRNFFEPISWHEVDTLCLAFPEHKIADPLKYENNFTAFAGSGGSGRIIKMVDSMNSTSFFALKVVELSYKMQIERELGMLVAHKIECGCPWIVQPICTEIVSTPNLCGYLMHPLGEKHVTSDLIFSNNYPSLHNVLEALLNLHVHNSTQVFLNIKFMILLIRD